MTRRPTRDRRRPLKGRPVTFSRFARSVANLATAYLKNHALRESPPRALTPPIEPVKKKTANEESKREDSSSSKGKRAQTPSNDVVQVDFAFFDPKPDDFHGIKMLLQTYPVIKQWDLSGFVDLITGQPSVGTVVKEEDNDEDAAVFSVVSALNLARYKCFCYCQDHKCIIQFKEFFLNVCKDKTVIDDLRLLVGKQAHSVGLLVSQHVNNLPPQLLPHLYDALFDEVSWAVEDEPTEELRNSFRFESYLLITKVYELKNVEQKNRSRHHDEEIRIFPKLEDEIFHELCTWSFTYPLHGESVTTDELKNYRLKGLAMAFKADKVSEFRKKLHSSIEES